MPQHEFATVPQQAHSRFMICTAEVTESQQLWSVLEGLVSSGCKGVEPGTLLHCRGQIQQDVHKTVGEAMICAGCTLSLAKPGFTDRLLLISYAGPCINLLNMNCIRTGTAVPVTCVSIAALTKRVLLAVD